MSKVHKAYFLDLYLPSESRQREFATEAEESLVAQARIEASDRDTFEAYLRKYFA
jgi:hypothetical protein